jgi:hypothetical protein
LPRDRGKAGFAIARLSCHRGCLKLALGEQRELNLLAKQGDIDLR